MVDASAPLRNAVANERSLASHLRWRLAGISVRLATGATFVAAGAFFGFFGLEYRLGSMRSMGPGMLPVAGGVLLLLIGATLLLRRDRASEAVQPFAWRTLSAVLGSVVVFALSVDVLGLAIAAPLLIFGAVIATGQGSIRLFAVLALVLTVGTSLVFPYLLGVPLKVLP